MREESKPDLFTERQQLPTVVRTSQIQALNRSKKPLIPVILQNYQLPIEEKIEIQKRTGMMTAGLKNQNPEYIAPNQMPNLSETVYDNNKMNRNMNELAKQESKRQGGLANFLGSLPWWTYLVLGSFVFVFACMVVGFSILNNIEENHMQQVYGDRTDLKYTVLTEKCPNGLFAYKGRCIECPNNLVKSGDKCVMREYEKAKFEKVNQQPRIITRQNPSIHRHFEEYDPYHQGLFSATRQAGRGVYSGIARVGRGTRRVGSRVLGGVERVTRSILS